MDNQIDHIVEHLFSRKGLDDVPQNELEEFIALYPYFAAGHFLLAKKTQISHPEYSREKVFTTGLYYNNALWLQWLLDQDISTDRKKQEIEEPVSHGNIENGSQEQNIDAGISVESQQVEVFEQPEVNSSTNIPGSVDGEYDLTSANEFSAAAENTTGSVGEHEAERVHDYESGLLHNIPDIPTTETEENVSGADKSAKAESLASAASIERTLSSAALIPTKAELEKNEFTFEPYHTIDYFASQGIKLQQSDLSKDKFGKQLKSFTEWLRSMKRLPQASLEANMDEATQQSIQDIAEHSFEEKEIVTETMVEVWIKQGNKEKAIDTLHKLSLLNPSKSHYFAAKIEQLKAL